MTTERRFMFVVGDAGHCDIQGPEEVYATGFAHALQKIAARLPDDKEIGTIHIWEAKVAQSTGVTFPGKVK